MEAIHQVIDGSILNKVITLPKPMQDMVVEVIIKPVKKQSKPRLTRSELRAMLKGSHTEALTGIISNSGDMSLKKHRAERRAKYECVN